jgi:hypothetical protein
MRIEREKFFVLTARLAGFWPNAGCVIRPGGGTAVPGETVVDEVAPAGRGIGGRADIDRRGKIGARSPGE